MHLHTSNLHFKYQGCMFHLPLTLVGEGNGNPLQYSCLENPMDRGAWQSIGLQRVRHNWATTLVHCCYCSVVWSCWLFETSWTAARQAPLSSIISWRFLRVLSIESGMLSNHLIHYCNTFGQKEKRKLLNQRKQKGNCIVRLPGPRTMFWRNNSTVMLWDRFWK